MILDFHTHTFPDKIAEKTIISMATAGNISYYGNGTLSGLKSSMKGANIDYSVILPVATATKQVASINRLAFELNGKDGILYAGAIHPDSENPEQILDEIKAAGLFGIKLHPDYQGAYFDDPRNIRIMEAAAKRGLYIVTHAGLDVAYPDDIHCTPDMVLNVLDKLKGVIEDKLILAHLGGHALCEEVIEKLVGKPVYMDTAVVLDMYPDKCQEIIKRHGAEKILFATDWPWAPQKKFVDMLGSFELTEEDKNKIFLENGKKLLSSAGVAI